MSSVSLGLMAYGIFFAVFVLMAFIFDKFYDANHGWRISRAKLMKCPKCQYVFLEKHYSRIKKCPHCGEENCDFQKLQLRH